MVQWYTVPELQSHHDHAFGTRKPGTRALPAGHDEASFQAALDKFRAVVGDENAVTGEGLVDFRDPYPLFEEGYEASAGIWLVFKRIPLDEQLLSSSQPGICRGDPGDPQDCKRVSCAVVGLLPGQELWVTIKPQGTLRLTSR